MWRKENCSCECKLVQPLWETVWMFLKKWKIELPCDLAIPLLGIYLKKTTLTSKNIYTSMFIEALFTQTKMWRQPKCPSVDERTKKT